LIHRKDRCVFADWLTICHHRSQWFRWSSLIDGYEVHSSSQWSLGRKTRRLDLEDRPLSTSSVSIVLWHWTKLVW
jgi:hypothetical protein